MNYDQCIQNYDKKVGELTQRYESVQFESVHESLVSQFPERGDVLDIGAGSGRDAAWLAERGHRSSRLSHRSRCLNALNHCIRRRELNGFRIACRICAGPCDSG